VAALRRWEGMSNATGIRLLYCEMERPGNLPSYPPEQHYGRWKTFRLVHHLAKQIRVPCRTRAGSKNRLLVQPCMIKKTTILSQCDKQLQLRNKLRLGTWNIRSMLQLGKVQLFGDEMMRLGVDYVDCQRWDRMDKGISLHWMATK